MIYYWHYICLFFILLISFIRTEFSLKDNLKDDFRETLFITRLKNQKFFAQFDFNIKVGNVSSQIYDLFPRTIGEIVEKHSLDYLSFSLAFSNWLTNDWGYQPYPEHPVGSSLKVVFHNNSDPDSNWPNLVNALSGIFCGSWHNSATYYTRTINKFYKEAVFPEESVCTENFFPFLKILPCKGVAGIASLMNTETFYAADFNSISLNFNITTGILKVVVNFVASKDKGLRNFDFESIFGKTLSSSSCQLASSSKVYIEKFQGMEFSVVPNKILKKYGREFLMYDLLVSGLTSVSGKFQDPTIKPRERLSYPPMITIYSSTSHVGEQSGNVITKIRNKYSTEIDVVLSQSIQWYIKIFLHSLTFQCDGVKVPFSFKHIIQSRIRDRPYYYEISTTLPKNSLCVLKFNYGLHLLKTSEYPPDAEKGRVIEGIKLDLLLPSEIYFSNATYINIEETDIHNSFIKFTIYGHPISIQLPLPDFSMPFNVICMVCTVMFNFYGSFHALSTKVFLMSTGSINEQPILRRILLRLRDKIRNFFNRKSLSVTEEKLKTD
ncbi:GPI transamidase component PIG-T [Strongyloides ratti]|uniref:GPI transamidase component PIG-T n=1 Tax=Strongyloides ratti TaxID=34506 RepID=A0A090L7S9_STRRB|nr:GPI transamidase component PIG-T [Strongyloides ratti]CEF65856.1 GPI transamidase component PIG-T [Strongyloides ratti]